MVIRFKRLDSIDQLDPFLGKSIMFATYNEKLCSGYIIKVNERYYFLSNCKRYNGLKTDRNILIQYKCCYSYVLDHCSRLGKLDYDIKIQINESLNKWWW